MKEKITVALIYDFDGTLAPGNMQEYDFIPAVGKSNMEFWHEANTLAEEQDADQVLTYMARMIQAAQSKGLSLRREAFRESGRNVKFYRGVEEWFKRINRYGEEHGVRILHYVNSSGLKEIIEGTSIAHEFKNIYACSFLYNVDGIAYWPAVAVNYTNKTQFIFKINKGVESVFDTKDVNRFMEESKRPVPFSRMIYFGDGTTDIPCMKLVNSNGGHSIGVYNSETKDKSKVHKMLRDRRIKYFVPADYREGGELDLLVKAIIENTVTREVLENKAEIDIDDAE
jgi:2-hydroxy-3-keto-5-methylthiopentenyl-1-phosphate phosphatase